MLLTDAHASPARIFLTAGREQLYDYQIRNKQADAILKILLRMYPGLQREYVDISESVIAGYARLDMAGVVKILQAAQKENILRYQPRNEKPQLVFLKERVDVTNLTIDQEKFNFRRKNALHRLEQILLYADKKQCRSQQLVAYFGEKNAAKCGICDICTGRNESDINEEVIERYEKKLREVLRLEPLSLEEVLKAFTMKRHALVVEVLQFLTNEGKIEEDESGRIMFL